MCFAVFSHLTHRCCSGCSAATSPNRRTTMKVRMFNSTSHKSLGVRNGSVVPVHKSNNLRLGHDNGNNNNNVTPTSASTSPSTFFFGFFWKARKKDKDVPPPSPDETKLYLEEAVLERKIPDSDLRQLVDLPVGLDYNEWLASHTIAFFEHINLIYGTISEFCTMSGCPDMVGAGQRQYQWYDEKGKKCKIAAPQYIDYVMTFTQKTINDESIFPSKSGNEFPSSFESIVKKINRLLFHVLAHVYHAHFKELWMLGLHSHLNCLFAHVILFNERFKQIDDKEIEILNDLIVALKLKSDLNDIIKSDESDDSETTAPQAATSVSSSGSAGGDAAVVTALRQNGSEQQRSTKDGNGLTNSSSVSSSSSSTAGITTTSELASLTCEDVKWQQH